GKARRPRCGRSDWRCSVGWHGRWRRRGCRPRPSTCVLWDVATRASRPPGIWRRRGTWSTSRRGRTKEKGGVPARIVTVPRAGSGLTIVEGVGFAGFIFRDTATPATLSGVTIHAPLLFLSCLYNYGAVLTVRDSVMEDCTATIQVGTSYAGGAIYTYGDLLLERVTVRNNTADPAANGKGGGLYVAPNPAGGPVVRILASEFSGNTALDGGAIYIEPGARVFVDGTLVTGNSA